MEQAANLKTKVQAINEILRGIGKPAVQEIKMIGKDGKIMGQVKYGYKPQYVFDAVNDILGAEDWRYELLKEEIFDSQAVAEVKLYLKVDGEWLAKGSQKGQSQIVKGNVGDAQKGSITNALLKCLSLISVGSDAYKGLLEPVFNANARSTNTRPATAKSTPKKTETAQTPAHTPAKSEATPQAPAPVAQKTPAESAAQSNQTDSVGLPQIAGINYERRDDGIVVATGKGTYDKRNLLKSAGFVFNQIVKDAWAKNTGVTA